MKEDLPLFFANNHHTEASGKPPHIDANIRKRYHGYFENEYGEQMIFVFDYEVGEGTLWSGDVGWELPHKVVDGTVPEILLGESEAVWLGNCWKTATQRLPK